MRPEIRTVKFTVLEERDHYTKDVGPYHSYKAACSLKCVMPCMQKKYFHFVHNKVVRHICSTGYVTVMYLQLSSSSRNTWLTEMPTTLPRTWWRTRHILRYDIIIAVTTKIDILETTPCKQVPTLKKDCCPQLQFYLFIIYLTLITEAVQSKA